MAIPENKVVKLVNEYSHLVLEIEGEATTEGTRAELYTDSEKDHQRWRLKPVDSDNGGFYNIENVHSAMSLEVVNYSKEPGAEIVQRPYGDGPLHRQWKLVPVAGKTDVYKIENRNSGLVLDDAGGQTKAPAPVKQYRSWNDDGRQQWKLVLAEHPVTPTTKVPVAVELFQHPLGYPANHAWTKEQRSVVLVDDTPYLKAGEHGNPIADFPTEVSAIKIHPGPDYDPGVLYEVHLFNQRDYGGEHVIRTLGLGEPNLHFQIGVGDNVHSIKFVAVPRITLS